ncbi:MAG: hypothetical protein R3C27_02105 [Hyphomonadaceae bacterium]
MPDNITPILEIGQEAQRHYRERGNDLDVRIATWALIGNGAALLLCFNGLLDRKICDWAAVLPFVQVFLLGLTCAFAKVVFTQAVFERSERQMILITAGMRTATAHIEAKKKALASGTEDELSKKFDQAIAEIKHLQRGSPLTRWLSRFASWSLAASVVCFGGAIFVAVNSNLSTSALCAAP